jgi:RNA polymerase sigma factor (TIGR02999 family)
MAQPNAKPRQHARNFCRIEDLREIDMSTATPPGSVTALLRLMRSGDRVAQERLLDAIYPELHRIAAHHFRRERNSPTMQPTALVNEAYLRLVAHDEHHWRNRAHFFGAAANIIRRILVDHARARQAGKRGEGQDLVPLDEAVAVIDNRRPVELLALDSALAGLEAISPRESRIVELRYFAGLTVPEVAEVLGMSPRAVDRAWAIARAWLHRELRPSASDHRASCDHADFGHE